jgi:hypothetical protein
MVKSLKKLGIKGTYFNTMQAIYDKPLANIILSGEKPEITSSKVRNEAMLSTVPTLIQYDTRIPSQRNKKRGGNKMVQIGKEEVKLSLFVDDIILYLKDMKDSTKKPSRSNKHFGNVAEYKISIEKLVSVLYTSSEQAEKKAGKQFHSQ